MKSKKNLPTEKFCSDFSYNVGEETCEERQSAIKDWKPLVGSRKVFSILFVWSRMKLNLEIRKTKNNNRCLLWFWGVYNYSWHGKYYVHIKHCQKKNVTMKLSLFLWNAEIFQHSYEILLLKIKDFWLLNLNCKQHKICLFYKLKIILLCALKVISFVFVRDFNLLSFNGGILWT